MSIIILSAQPNKHTIITFFIKYKNDIRNTWKTINSIIGKQNDKPNMAQRFKINDNLVSESKQITNKFCEVFFTNIVHDYASKIPKSKYDAKHYLHLNKIKQSKSIFITSSDTEEIRQILGKLKCKNSSGHDEISCRFLQAIGEYIPEPLCKLVNKYICEGIFPDTLKIAKVNRIYKNKEKCNVSNYKPISLLSSLSKILEKVMHNRLYSFF